MKSIEVSARTIEDAVSEGLAKLHCSISDCKVEILHEGAKGLFGFFGSKPASVRLTLVEDDADDDSLGDLKSSLSCQDEKPAKAKVDRPAKPKEDRPAAKVKDEKPVRADVSKAPATEKKPSDVMERFKSAPLPGTQEQKPAPVAKPAAAAVAAARAAAQAKAQQAKAEPRPEQPRSAPKPQRQPRPHTEYDDESDRPVISRTPVPAPENIVTHRSETLEGRAQQFLLEITKRMGVQVQVDVHTNEEGHLYATMYGDTLGILIGRRGDTLDALQYLTSLQVNQGKDDYTRVTLDTENYRAKREEALTRLAARMANRAVKTGRKVSLEPMNPYERRILHASLQSNPNVSTHSEGDEPYRHVVVVPEKQ